MQLKLFVLLMIVVVVVVMVVMLIGSGLFCGDGGYCREWEGGGVR